MLNSQRGTHLDFLLSPRPAHGVVAEITARKSEENAVDPASDTILRDRTRLALETTSGGYRDPVHDREEAGFNSQLAAYLWFASIKRCLLLVRNEDCI